MTSGSTHHAGTLHYAGFDSARRPGLLTALAVCSIVFGSLGLLYNLLGAAASGTELASWGAVAGPSNAATSADTTTPGTLSAADAELIVGALAEIQPLTQAERRRLAEAFRRAEAPIGTPVAPLPWTADHVKRQVVDSATHLPGDPYEFDDEVEVEIGDASGVVDEPEVVLQEGDPATDTYEEREIHFDFGGNGDARIYEDQIDLYALPMDGPAVDTTVWADGRIEAVADDYDGGYFWWDLQLWMTVAAGLAGCALAVVLVIAGIQTLRDRPSAARLHRIWAWARIGLGAAAVAIAAWGMAQMGDFAGMGRLFWAVMGAALVIQFLLTTGYAFAVLIVLRTPRVRDWYGRSADNPPEVGALESSWGPPR